MTSGYGPGQLTLGVPGGAGVLDQMTSGGPFQSQTFCDFVILWTTITTSIILMDKSKINKWMKVSMTPIPHAGSQGLLEAAY